MMRASAVYAALWIAWIGFFLAVEFTALATHRSQFTLSDFVWKLEQINRGWTFLRYFVCVFCVWLLLHMSLGWFR